MEAVGAGWMADGIWDGHTEAWLSEGGDNMEGMNRQNEEGALHDIFISGHGRH